MGAYVTPQELGSRFLRPHDVSGALCSVAAQLGTLQQEHQRLRATNVGCSFGEENVGKCRENVDLWMLISLKPPKMLI
jgi:hypothetical protein